MVVAGAAASFLGYCTTRLARACDECEHGTRTLTQSAAICGAMKRRQQAASSRVPLLLATCYQLLLAQAEPDLFISGYAYNDCFMVPTSGHAAHKRPQADPQVTVTLSGPQGNSIGPSSSVCPGATYHLDVKFPEAREALVSANFGVMGAYLGSVDFGCTNRFLTRDRRTVTSMTSTLQLPCSNQMNGQPLVIKVTSAKAENDHYHNTTATWAVSATCGVGECQTAATPPAATAPPSPSLLNPSPPFPQPQQQSPSSSHMPLPPPMPPLPPFPPSPVPPSPPAPPLPSFPVRTTFTANFTALSASSSAFLSDYTRQLATGLSVATSQITGVTLSRVAALRRLTQDSATVTSRVTAASAETAESLQLALLQYQRSPEELLGAALLSQYGIMQGSVLAVVVGIQSPPPSPAPPPQPGGTCPSSPLGYECALTTQGVTIHWSTRGPMPSNACTTGATAAGNASAYDGVLHMAFTASTAGYVGIGFSASDTMTDSDIVMGWIAGATDMMVDTWSIPSGNTDTKNNFMSPASAARPSWAAYKGVSQTSSAATGPQTTICFSRRLVEPSASVSKTLTLDAPLHLIFAVHNARSFTEHTVDGTFDLILGSGALIDTTSNPKLGLMDVHGALMTVAWVFLLPLGVLVARHKWLLGDTRVCNGIHLWFYLHMGLQLSGLVLVVVGFAYAWSYLPGGGGSPTGGDVGAAHMILGTVVFALAGLQILAGYIRPAPSGKLRPAWNLVHHNLGRITVLASWATIYLGIYIAHGSPTYQSSYYQWVVPVAVVMGLMIITDGILTVFRSRRERQERFWAHVDAKKTGQNIAGVADLHVAAAEVSWKEMQPVVDVTVAAGPEGKT